MQPPGSPYLGDPAVFYPEIRDNSYCSIALLEYNIIMILLYGGAFMNIKPSASIRQNYNDIAELCRSTGEPVYLTKNGEGDLVVMDINSFTKREKMLKLREELLAVEEDRLHGAPDYSVDEVASMMDQAIRETCHAGA
jgi:PHD/YefM family antitoxin component YafN of YafNO toxin-antitoxin module